MCRGVDTSGRIRRLPIGAERVARQDTDNWNVWIRHDGARSNLFLTRCCATTTVTYHSAPILKPTNALHTFARRAVRAEVTVRAPLTSHGVAPCATRTPRWTSPPNSTQARIVSCACNPVPWWCSRRASTQRSAKRARYDSDDETMDVRKYDCSHSECNVDGNTIVHTALPQMKLSFGVHSPLGWYNFLFHSTNLHMPRVRRSSSCRRRGRRCRTSVPNRRRSTRRHSRRTRRVPPVIGFPAGASNEPWYYSEYTLSEPVRATVIKLPMENRDSKTQTSSPLATVTSSTQVISAPSSRKTAQTASTETQTTARLPSPSPNAPTPSSSIPSLETRADEWLQREYDRGRVRSVDDGRVIRERTRDKVSGHFVD